MLMCKNFLSGLILIYASVTLCAAVDTRILSVTIFDVWGCASASLPGASSPLQDSSCAAHLNVNESLPVCVTNPTAWHCATDFERYSGDDVNVVNYFLNTTHRVPTLNTSASHPSVIDANQFASCDPSFNIPIPANLTLSNNGTGSSLVYSFNSSNFFPIDGRGFGNSYISHNYGFTLSYNGMFTYQGNEYFQFRSDDDLFVYINNRLAVNLGGIHSAETGNIDLTWPTGGCPSSPYPNVPCITSTGLASDPCACLLGLASPGVGGSYTIDIFYAERHTPTSTLSFTTSIYIICPYYDWCGVCQGDGQSCCGTKCNDYNDCTQDSCDASTGSCVHTELVCQQPSDKCQENVCQPGIGCVTQNIQCPNSTMACLEATCDSQLGCINTTVVCPDDNDVCTNDACSNTLGCNYAPINCDNGNACTNNTCDPLLGCVYDAIVCEDYNSCTFDSCNTSTGCIFTPINCNDNNACTIDNCNTTTGCYSIPIDCDDNNICTNDTCNSISGCVHYPIDCNDNNNCTMDSCNNGCIHSNIDCNDNNACTVDSCNNITGCQYSQVICNDFNECTMDMCNKTTGCVFVPIDCNVKTVSLTNAVNTTLNSTSSIIKMYFPASPFVNVSYGIAISSSSGYQDPEKGPGNFQGTTFFMNFFANGSLTHIPPNGTFLEFVGDFAENSDLYYFDTDSNQWTKNCYSPTINGNILRLELCHASQYAIFNLKISSSLSKASSATIIAVVVVVLVVAIVVLAGALFVYRKKLLLKNSDIPLSPILPVIKDVKILGPIGKGNFGEVYKGDWKGTIVALKKLKSSSKEDYEDFAKESDMLFKLSHPNIVQFMGIYTNEEEAKFIVTEFMPNGDLLSLIRANKEIQVEEMVEMCRQAAAGMVYLEDQHIVHRDLALRNFLVTASHSKYTIKVADFGLSRNVGNTSFYVKEDGLLPIKWASPESLQYGQFSSKSDVWSFGICMWELFSQGEIPYFSLSNKETMEQVFAGYRLPQPKKCPDDMYKLMLECWNLEPEQRPKFIDILAKIPKEDVVIEQPLKYEEDKTIYN